MKFTIETEDESEHRSYLAGPRIGAALHSFSEALRGKIKYREPLPQYGHPPPKPLTWEVVRELFLEHCGEVLTKLD